MKCRRMRRECAICGGEFDKFEKGHIVIFNNRRGKRKRYYVHKGVCWRAHNREKKVTEG